MRQVYVYIDQFVGLYLVNGFIQVLSSLWKAWLEHIIGVVHLIHTVPLRQTLLPYS